MVRHVDTLLVVAHPDDETIYFGPWLLNGLGPRCDVVVVTDGNHAGRSLARQAALRGACADLGVREVEQWDFLDHPGLALDVDAMQSRLHSLQEARGYAQVLTHAPHGEYGHFNHIDVSIAVHRAFAGRAEVWVPADKLYATAEVALEPAAYAAWAQVLITHYPKEVREAFRDVSLPRTTGALQIELDEAEAIYGLCMEGEPPDRARLKAYAHLADVLECFLSVPKTF